MGYGPWESYGILESVVVPFTEQKTPHLHYKDQSVNVVQANNRCLC